MGSAVHPVWHLPSQYRPGAYPEAEQGVHIHAVQCVHLARDRESVIICPQGCIAPLDILGSSRCPAAMSPHLILLTCCGVRDIVAWCSFSCRLPPAQGGPGMQGTAGTQHHGHLVLAAVVMEVHRRPQVRDICGDEISRVARRQCALPGVLSGTHRRPAALGMGSACCAGCHGVDRRPGERSTAPCVCHPRPIAVQMGVHRGATGNTPQHKGMAPGTHMAARRGGHPAPGAAGIEDVKMLGVQGPPGTTSRWLLPCGGRAVAVPHTPRPADGTAAPPAQGPQARPPQWPALQGARCR